MVKLTCSGVFIVPTLQHFYQSKVSEFLFHHLHNKELDLNKKDKNVQPMTSSCILKTAYTKYIGYISNVSYLTDQTSLSVQLITVIHRSQKSKSRPSVDPRTPTIHRATCSTPPSFRLIPLPRSVFLSCFENVWRSQAEALFVKNNGLRSDSAAIVQRVLKNILQRYCL